MRIQWRDTKGYEGFTVNEACKTCIACLNESCAGPVFLTQSLDITQLVQRLTSNIILVRSIDIDSTKASSTDQGGG